MASPESKKLLELLWKNYPGPSNYEKMKDKVGKMRDNFVQDYHLDQIHHRAVKCSRPRP